MNEIRAMLQKGSTYAQIQEELGVSPNKIAEVSKALKSQSLGTSQPLTVEPTFETLPEEQLIFGKFEMGTYKGKPFITKKMLLKFKNQFNQEFHKLLALLGQVIERE